MKKRLDREEIRKLVEEGVSDSDIARKLGCNWDYVQKIRTKELGIKKTRGDIKANVAELLKTCPDKSYSDIALMANTNAPYVSVISKSLGMSRHTKSRETRMALDLWRALNEGPKWADELKELSAFYKTLRLSELPVKRFAFRSSTIYFKDGDEAEAFQMIVNRFNVGNLRRRIGRALGIINPEMIKVEKKDWKDELKLEWL